MPLWPRWRARYRVSLPRGVSRLPVLIEGLNGSSIFRLTRVTRIFQKKIFTETTPGARAACRAGFFVARAARAAARGGFLVFAEKNRKIQRRSKPCRFKRAKAEIRTDGRAGSSNGQTRRHGRYCRNVQRGTPTEQAEGGDMAAIRVCMERLVPPIKHQPVAVELPPIQKPADSVEAVASIAAAGAAGDLTAAEAAELAKVVDVYVGALASKG